MYMDAWYIGMHEVLVWFPVLILSFSDVSDHELEKHISIEVWNWNRMTRNNFVGGMSIKINNLISDTCDGRVDQWYKLLDETQGRKQNLTIIRNEEAIEKVSIKSVALIHLVSCFVIWLSEVHYVVYTVGLVLINIATEAPVIKFPMDIFPSGSFVVQAT